jgi:peptidyl-prolyl cis-trans isomerase C
MLLSRPTFGPGIAIVGAVCLCLTAHVAARGQQTGKSAPSPIAPGDLSKPVFDTKTPVYDAASRLDKASGTVVAEVEGRPITLGNVRDAIAALPAAMSKMPLNEVYPTVLDQLIRQQALVVRAQQQGMDEDPVVKRQMRTAADMRLSEEYMQRELSKGITEVRLLERYDRDIAGRPGPEEVHVRVILVGTEKEAEDLIARLRGGADFAEVARGASTDASAPMGGDLGFVTREGMIPEIGAVAFALPQGQISAFPVHGEAGWFVVKVETRRNQPTPAFASVREQLRLTLMREGVLALSTAAGQGLKIRTYNVDGTEPGAEKPDAQ